MFIENLKDPEAAGLLSSDIEKLQGLLNDLKGLRAGNYPSNDTLAKAPFLNDYLVIKRGIAALSGDVSGHPIIPGNDAPMVSSPLFIVLKDIGAARTLSRWYRLGDRASR
ncbi:hypothetical protein JM93_03182 [Roseibium hamelinense]|uniref:Uncharacterized protein n=1 Tax=Roseibium hamelinense TaxID=150831 RepID=A0A562SU46_9HYPH|nr:DUF6634 family protein [Roseibium hamelinense]MTI42511.1 hypothetical protein [Roseibium hamelinense]TWI84845.1 hypothetical protein JM93_03182 [Roseibium hamelinense]